MTKRTELVIVLTPHLISGDVMVSAQDIEIGKEAIKSTRDYPEALQDISSAEIFVPLEQEEPAFKGAIDEK